RTGVHLPVESAEFIAKLVLPIFGELAGESAVRAAMKTAQNPLDHRAHAQLHPGKTPQQRGLQKSVGGGRHLDSPQSMPDFGSGVFLMIALMILSESACSDSAK